MKKYVVSEIFRSVQGEGAYTGQLTMWVRFFLCNLQCQGFGQKEPTKPDTYKFDVVDPKSYKSMEDVPVLQYGCDSAYSWAKQFKHLCNEYTAEEISNKIISLAVGYDYNKSQVAPHLAFTGGEPMLQQDAIMDILDKLYQFKNITIETNGTQKLKDSFVDYFKFKSTEVFMSVSPKLFNVSGEENSKAIQPEIVAEYQNRLNCPGQLKFVLTNSDAAWNELEEVVDQFRAAGCTWPVWIMPVGSTKEQQLGDDVTAVAEEAVRRGYNVSGRVHSYLFGNGVGK
jgi:7-carboxy-7-deazaguanine synthase